MVKFIESRMIGARGWGGAVMERYFLMELMFNVLQNEKSLEMKSGDGCPKM